MAQTLPEQGDIAARVSAGTGPIELQNISELTELTDPASLDWLLCAPAEGGAPRKCDVGNFAQTADITAGTLTPADGNLNLSGGLNQILVSDGVGNAAFASPPRYEKSILIESPTDADDFGFWAINESGKTVTIDRITCRTDAGTVTLDVTINDGTPADINGTDIVCDSDGQTASSPAGDTGFDDGEYLGLVVTSTATSPARLLLNVSGTVSFQ